LVQTPLVQSFFVLHALSIGHLLQNEPPQSVSDSPPFFTPSLQVGGLESTLESTPLDPPVPGPVVVEVVPSGPPGPKPP
jgi:hypothetical protein